MLQTIQPNNLDNAKYGKLPRSVGEAKNVSVNVYILILFTLNIGTVQLPCIGKVYFYCKLLFNQQNHEDLKCFRI